MCCWSSPWRLKEKLCPHRLGGGSWKKSSQEDWSQKWHGARSPPQKSGQGSEDTLILKLLPLSYALSKWHEKLYVQNLKVPKWMLLKESYNLALPSSKPNVHSQISLTWLVGKKKTAPQLFQPKLLGDSSGEDPLGWFSMCWLSWLSGPKCCWCPGFQLRLGAPD